MYIRISVPERFQFRIMPTIQNLLFHNTKDLHYIGGAEILPPPLDAEKESACIEQLQTEEGQTAKQKLIEHNLRLVVYIAKKFDNTGIGKVSYDKPNQNTSYNIRNQVDKHLIGHCQCIVLPIIVFHGKSDKQIAEQVSQYRHQAWKENE